MIAFLITSVVAFMAYVCGTVLVFGVPASISETYYLFKNKKIGKSLFAMWGMLTCFPLLIYWLDKSPNNLQFLAFITCAGLMFVCAASEFKSDKLTKRVHFTGASLSVIGSQLWVFLTNIVLLPFTIGLLILLGCVGWRVAGKVSEGESNSLVFFLEIGIFITTFLGVTLFK